MTLLFIIDDLRSGGAQRQIVNLAIEFKKNGHDAHFLIYYPMFFYVDTLDQYGIKYTCLQRKNPLSRILAFRQQFQKHRPDAVIAFMGIPAFISEVASLGIKKWLLIAGERSSDPKILSSIKSRLIRLSHILSDYVTFNSHVNLELVKRINPFLREQKMRVIYNMIDFDRWVQINIHKAKSKNKEFEFQVRNFTVIGIYQPDMVLTKTFYVLDYQNKVYHFERGMRIKMIRLGITDLKEQSIIIYNYAQTLFKRVPTNPYASYKMISIKGFQQFVEFIKQYSKECSEEDRKIAFDSVYA